MTLSALLRGDRCQSKNGIMVYSAPVNGHMKADRALYEAIFDMKRLC
jgi:hypothetical protein